MTSILVEEGRLAARSVGAEGTGVKIVSQCDVNSGSIIDT